MAIGISIFKVMRLCADISDVSEGERLRLLSAISPKWWVRRAISRCV